MALTLKDLKVSHVGVVDFTKEVHAFCVAPAYEIISNLGTVELERLLGCTGANAEVTIFRTEDERLPKDFVYLINPEAEVSPLHKEYQRTLDVNHDAVYREIAAKLRNSEAYHSRESLDKHRTSQPEVPEVAVYARHALGEDVDIVTYVGEMSTTIQCAYIIAYLPTFKNTDFFGALCMKEGDHTRDLWEISARKDVLYLSERNIIDPDVGLDYDVTDLTRNFCDYLKGFAKFGTNTFQMDFEIPSCERVPSPLDTLLFPDVGEDDPKRVRVQDWTPKSSRHTNSVKSVEEVTINSLMGAIRTVLIKVMRERNMHIGELADAVGIGMPELEKMLNGTIETPMWCVCSLAIAMDIPVSALMTQAEILHFESTAYKDAQK